VSVDKGVLMRVWTVRWPGVGHRRLRRRRPGSGQQGAAAVEFGLVLPLLVILVFGIISFGILFAQKLALENGARQASRFAVVGQQTCSTIKAEAQKDAVGLGIGSTATSVTVLAGMVTLEAGGYTQGWSRARMV